jgi:hypothetical protein
MHPAWRLASDDSSHAVSLGGHGGTWRQEFGDVFDIMYNRRRMGQLFSLDKAYASVPRRERGSEGASEEMGGSEGARGRE